MNFNKVCISFFGLPGAGKGTQANLIIGRYGLLFNFDTGRMLEGIWNDPSRQGEPLVIKEKHLFDTGVLNSPEFVLAEVSREAQSIARAGAGVVYSGSPRTRYEAEGEGNTPGLIEVLEREYGKERMFFFFLNVDTEVAIGRNSRRLLCTVCKKPVLMQYAAPRLYWLPRPVYLVFMEFFRSVFGFTKHCPDCGGPLYRRTLDDPKTIRNVRMKEYRERTLPVVDILRDRGHEVYVVDGERAPNVVFEDIRAVIDARLQSHTK